MIKDLLCEAESSSGGTSSGSGLSVDKDHSEEHNKNNTLHYTAKHNGMNRLITHVLRKPCDSNFDDFHV